MCKFIVRNVPERDITELRQKIPGLIVLCAGENARVSYMHALWLAGDECTVQLEDDIELCNGFYRQVNRIINAFPSDVINFFSRRHADKTVGTRYIGASQFSSHVCYYMPKGMARCVLDYAKNWDGWEKDPSGTDILFPRYLVKAGVKRYLNIVPSLVQHKHLVSAIDSRRSKNRQSDTYHKERRPFCNSPDGMYYRNQLLGSI